MTKANSPALYVFVRTDIPIADQIVQVGHVCALAASTFTVPDRCRLVLLAVDNDAAIGEAVDRCQQHDIRSVTFYESDAVENGQAPMGATATCTEPIPWSARRPLRRYRLWREPRQLANDKCHKPLAHSDGRGVAKPG